MSPHFCRVGNIKPNLDKLSNFKNDNNKKTNSIKEIEKIEYHKKH